jgi:1,4-dihydroxy-2-naphthoate octaprenyltransferase
MRIEAIIKIIDVKTFPAALLPVLLGSIYSLYAYGKMNSLLMLMLAVALLLIQASTNMLNDFFDYRRGIDSTEKADEKALVSGELTPHQVLILVATFVLVALIIGTIIAYQTNWTILFVAAAGAAVAVLYSSGPKPISYTPFGEAAAGITMGIGITSTVVYIQSAHFTWHSILMAFPTAVFIAYIMFTNNLCDLDKDKSAGRSTLPGLLGYEAAKSIWLLCCLVLVLMTVLLIIIGVYPVWDLLTSLILLNYRTLIHVGRYKREQFQKRKMMGIIGKLGVQYLFLTVIGLLITHALQSH